jgi:hypothetical protein
MTDIHIHQIFYSRETRKALDGGFDPLDNLANQRPDWREYWPIRNFLLSRAPHPDHYYGFFSPNFGAKTNLGAAAVYEFIHSRRNHANVFLFSPAFDQIALYRNCIEQAVVGHADQKNIAFWRECARLIDPRFSVERSISSSKNTVFCNYFVAKGGFWLKWLEICEIFFALAEADQTDFGHLLNSAAGGESVPRKVFVVERVVSVLLATHPQLPIAAYNPMKLNLSMSPVARHGLQLVVLDALKTGFLTEGFAEYAQVFEQLRTNLLAI